MNKQEWLNWRKIGSSDAPVILGVSPWKTPRQLWEERVLGKEQPETFAMKRGTEMEQEARRCFEEKMNVAVFATNKEHKTIDFMTASLDGLDLDEKICVELKCPMRGLHHEIPEHYYPQLQHQLAVTGLPGMYYMSYDGTDGLILEVERDDKYIEKMIDAEAEFWDCLLEMEPPELTDRDYTLMTDEKWTQVAQSWLECHTQLKSMEKAEEQLRNQLIELANNQNSRGAGIQITKITVKGAIDYSKVPELQGVDLNQFRKAASNRWRLSSAGV